MKKEQEISSFIDRWLMAWSSKDLKEYGSCYANQFRSSSGWGRKTWLQYKNGLNKKYDYIHVFIKDLKVKHGKDKSTASFLQNYESSGYQTISKKTLMLIREGGEWKIYRETSEDI